MTEWQLLGGGNSNILGIFTPNLGEIIPIDSYFSDGLVPPPTSRKATSFWWSNFESWSPVAFHVYVYQNQEFRNFHSFEKPSCRFFYAIFQYLQWNVLKMELCRYMLFTSRLFFCIFLWLPPEKIHRHHHFREMNLSFGSTRLGFSRRRRVCVCFFIMKASHGAGVVNAFGLALFRYLSKTESEKLFAKVDGSLLRYFDP